MWELKGIINGGIFGMQRLCCMWHLDITKNQR